jgi:hypothetical protein
MQVCDSAYNTFETCNQSLFSVIGAAPRIQSSAHDFTFNQVKDSAMSLDFVPMRTCIQRANFGFFLNLRSNPLYGESASYLCSVTLDKLGGMAGVW